MKTKNAMKLVWRSCFVLAAVAAGLTVRADILKLKNGTTEDGDIVAEDANQFTIEVQNATGTVTMKHFVLKSNVVEVIRATAEEKAAKQMQRDYFTLQKYQLNPSNSYPAAYYGQVLTNGFLKFVTDHPGSPYQAEIDGKIAQWQTELSQVATGLVKYQGRWISSAEWTAQWQQQRAQQLLAQAQQLIAQQQLSAAGPVLDQVCALTNAPGDVLATAHQLRLDTYRQLPDLLAQRLQQLTNDFAACQAKLQQAEQDKKDALARHKAALGSLGFKTTQAPNQGGTSLPERIARGSRGGGGGTVQEPMKRLGADSSAIIASQTALNDANVAVADAQSCIEKVKAEQTVVGKNLAAAQARAAALHITATGVETAVVVAAAQPAPVPAAAASTDVLQDSSSWFQRNWIYLAGGLLVAVWLVSRLVK